MDRSERRAREILKLYIKQVEKQELSRCFTSGAF